MLNENMNMDEISDARRKAIARTIRTVDVEALKKLGEELFPFPDHPWFDVYFDFLKENAGSTFHYGKTDDHIHVIYCHSKEKGMWFIPKSGKGPMRARGLAVLKEIVETGH